jgi:DNA-binding transcriptional LysR family regulator
LVDRLGELDMSLLTTFDAMLVERNVSRAAERLGITQPALSTRIGRLRTIFDDQLFVPVAGRGMTPTPRAIALSDRLAELLVSLRDFVGPAPSFDPANSDRTFVLAAYDNPAAMLGPELVPALKHSAPNVRLAFVLPDYENMAAVLERGEVDLFIGVIKTKVTDLISRSLFNEEWMTAQRRGHPRGTGPLTMDEFCAADHLLISAEGAEFKGMVDDALGRLGRKRRVSVSIQSYALAPLILANSDCLCTLPRRFLRRFEGALDLFAPPLDLSKFHLQVLWHPRMQDDAPHRWLREQVFAAVAAQPAELLQGADVR